ncbi:MAG: hypothetical protein AB1782_10335 [Cyanobacteriota bacterium]
MVLYDENTDLDIEKFDIYNQYRDQICYLKLNKTLFNVALEPDSWQELQEIVFTENKETRLTNIRKWFLTVEPDKFGSNKEFDFSDGLFEKLIEELKTKFD